MCAQGLLGCARKLIRAKRAKPRKTPRAHGMNLDGRGEFAVVNFACEKMHLLPGRRQPARQDAGVFLRASAPRADILDVQCNLHPRWTQYSIKARRLARPRSTLKVNREGPPLQT